MPVNFDRMYIHEPDDNNSGSKIPPVSPYLDHGHDAGLPSQSASARKEAEHTVIDEYNDTHRTGTESSGKDLEPVRQDTHAPAIDNTPSRSATTHDDWAGISSSSIDVYNETPSLFGASQESSSSETPETRSDSAQADALSMFVEPAETPGVQETRPDPSADIGKTAVTLSQAEATVSGTEPTADYEDALSDLFDGEAPTAEPVYPSEIVDAEVEDGPTTADVGRSFGGGFGAAMDKLWRDPSIEVPDFEAAESESAQENDERGDTSHKVIELYKVEEADAGEGRDNMRILDIEDLDKEATADPLTEFQKEFYRKLDADLGATYDPNNPEASSPINRPPEKVKNPRPAWLERRLEPYFRKYGEMTLPALFMTHARAKQEAARKIQRERYEEIYKGLPGFWESTFHYAMPRVARNDEILRRKSVMKERDYFEKRQKALQRRAEKHFEKSARKQAKRQRRNSAEE